MNVKAQTTKFYEGEYIDNIYMVKYRPSKQEKLFQKARFFRKAGDNQPAYCIEPFKFFTSSADYEETANPNSLTPEQLTRIKKLVYYGYGYGNHTDNKWYAITQLMIWQAAEQTDSDYYFTDKLNGNRINIFQNEMNEINNLIARSNIRPSFTNQDIYFVEGKENKIVDTNNVLQDYRTNNKEISITNNEITISNLKEGNYNINLYQNNTIHNRPLLFYQAANSQNLVNIGDIDNINLSFRIHILKTKLQLEKIDADTKTKKPSGEASLDGAQYQLFDENNKPVATLEIKNNQAKVENLSFGKYYLKEIKPGKGYTLDDKKYEINITKDKPTIQLKLNNKVIEKKIIIEKKYGTENNFQSEKNIDFEIYNSKGELVKTISTNEEGICEIILPYGKYTVKQKNSTEGYTKVEPFEINVENTDQETISLKDYKIPVPNTSTSIYRYFGLLIKRFLHILGIC